MVLHCGGVAPHLRPYRRAHSGGGRGRGLIRRFIHPRSRPPACLGRWCSNRIRRAHLVAPLCARRWTMVKCSGFSIRMHKNQLVGTARYFRSPKTGHTVFAEPQSRLGQAARSRIKLPQSERTSNFAMERSWPFSSCSIEAGMNERRLRSAWCCCRRTGHAAHRECSAAREIQGQEDC